MRSFLTAAALLTAFSLQGAPIAAQSVAETGLSAADRAAVHEEIRSYLLENPEILTEMLAILEVKNQEAAAETDETLIAAHAMAIFNDGFSYEGGNPEGDLTLVEFVDYQCGYCRRAHPDTRALVEEDGNIRLIVKEMPILGPGSELAARAAIATLISEGPEAYIDLNDRLMRIEGQVTDPVLDATLAEAGLDPEGVRAGMDDAEVTRRIAETRGLAQALEIAGTPTFVVQGRMVRGYVPLAQMQALVDGVRAAN